MIGLYDVDLYERKSINDFKQAHLYNEEYKKCAKLHHSTKIFGEPLNCINDTFAVSSLELLGGSSTTASSPDMIHFIRNLSFDNDPLQSIEIISNQQGQIIRVEAELPADTKVEEMRSMAIYISKKHGQPDVTPPNPRMPLWGWISRDGFELRLFRDTSSGTNKFSITQRAAHQTLRDIKTKEKMEE